jgi:Cof subfamily protein (haloacid dehalogenase superfamily)
MIDKKKLRNLKLIVFDMDGTLLNSNGEIGKETIELVTELKNMGVRFSFASGRLHSAIIDHAKTLDLKTPLISLDGSIIKSYPEGKIIFESYIPSRYIKKAINYADNLLLKVALCHADAIYYTDLNATIPTLLDKFGAQYIEVDDYNLYMNNTLELVIAGDMKESVKLFNRKMMFPYAFGLNTTYYKSQSRGDLYYVEVRKSGSDKGTGLKRLCKHLKVKISETAVMGDWYNDRKLFETGALAIAPQNAISEIKFHAQYVTERSNDEDATAEFLNMVLEAKKN